MRPTGNRPSHHDETVSPKHMGREEERGIGTVFCECHNLLTQRQRGHYRERVVECERAMAASREAGIAGSEALSLRDLAPADLPALELALDPMLFRRVRHVIRENARVDAFCAALADDDGRALGALLAEGQRSLREDFEVSIEELDALCELANRLPGVIGSRLTGAGFGGCTVHLVSAEFGTAESDELCAGFEQRFGRAPKLWIAKASAGAEIL